MRYEADTPETYLHLLDNDWRKATLLAVRALLFKQEHELYECINYNMLCYQLDNQSVFHLNVQKQYVSLYVGDINKVADARLLLADFSLGKGCIRIKKHNDFASDKTTNQAKDALETFIKQTLAIWRDGDNTDC